MKRSSRVELLLDRKVRSNIHYDILLFESTTVLDDQLIVQDGKLKI